MRRSSSVSELTSDSKRIDHEIKQVHRQIALAEKSFANLIKNFSNVTVDLMRLQTRKDELESTLSDVAAEESPSLKQCLAVINTNLNDVNKILASHIGVIESRIIQSISSSVAKCKSTRSVLETCSTAKSKRANAMKHIENSSDNTKNDQDLEKNISQRTVLETTKQMNDLENEMRTFERWKVENMRSWLKIYLHSSLAYHVKAVEHYTNAYQALSLINVDSHVEHFTSKLFPSFEEQRIEFVRWNSFNSLSTK